MAEDEGNAVTPEVALAMQLFSYIFLYRYS